MDERRNTTHLRLLEIAGRTDVPVAEGALFPLLNSKEESERWENLYGKLGYKGCWSDFSRRPHVRSIQAGYHDPYSSRRWSKANPTSSRLPKCSRIHRSHGPQVPGEVVIWAGAPLTNIALALRLDPQVATLAKSRSYGRRSLRRSRAAPISHREARREFNWWFDPEAARIVLRAPWNKVTVTPIDISVKTTPGQRDSRCHRQGGYSCRSIPDQIF